MKDQFWQPTDTDLQGGEPLVWHHSISVRASSLTDVPDLSQLQPLDGDHYRLSFWVAVIEACQSTDNRAQLLLPMLRTAASAMKVTFLFCKDDQQAEQRKWRLSQADETASQNATLRGWKRVVGIVSLAQQLQLWSMDSTPDAVSKWLASQKVLVSAKVVRSMQSVHSRLTAVQADDVMEELENKCGSDHALSKPSVLEVLCQLTKIDKNIGLQSSLLRWTLEHLKHCLISKSMSASATREVVAANARAALLGRRMVMYLCTKLKMPTVSAEADVAEQPQQLVSYTTRETYLKSFMSHDRFYQSHLGNSATSDTTWCSDLMPFQQESITVLQQFLNCSPLYLEALLATVQGNPTISAEEALQQPAWTSLVDLPKLLEARQEDLIKFGYAPKASAPVVASTGAEAAAVAAESQPSQEMLSTTSQQEASEQACLSETSY